ncbi:electron transfer flavoprotein beta subunit [Colwellia chukchiensis]|uniref:Electron transfer flavoprotein subunit beta n=1 Tax=Colwellia chukchiensis TaxID=641665 RepID=A0A1H7I164_9GAMM|nr:electron transfer flavoprotein subunit beta/FixA family protein [Colwellia chukchiensis]SEK55150.1 electron transfer flavoprotein beta subunit [Colwellia chukchiensis]
MKVIVAVKRVIDFNSKVRVKADHSDVDLSHVKMALNPFCEIAIEAAIRLKEAGKAAQVIVISVGSSACQEQLRTALALGADRAIHIDAEDKLEPLNIAKLLAQVVEHEQAQLVILGKQSIDGDNNQTGQMLAALLGCGQATFASALQVNGTNIQVTREVDAGLQTLNLTLPAVVTADLRLHEPRYASLPNIMKAKRKVIDVTTPEALAVKLKQHSQQVAVMPANERSSGVLLDSVAALIEKLKNEAKVL